MLLAMALDLGGAETHVVGLAGGLARRGLRVTVVSAGGRLVERLQSQGIRHVEAQLDRRSPLALLRAVRLLRRLWRDEPPDVVHAHARIPAWAAERARGRAERPPIVTTYHGVYNAGWFWRRMSRWGDRAIAVSPEVRDHLVARLGAPADRVVVIPNGIDVHHFRPPGDAAVGERKGPVAEEPLVVHVGRLDEVLAPALALCGAIERLASAFAGLRAAIVGGGKGEARVRDAAAAVNGRLGREAVAVLGPVGDPLPWLQKAAVVVAAGRAALEALAAARPVVVFGAGGLAGPVAPETWEELAASNFSGRGRRATGSPGGPPRPGPPEDAAQLAEAIAGLLRDGAERQRLGRFGRELVERRYSEDAMVEAVLGVYRETWEGCRP